MDESNRKEIRKLRRLIGGCQWRIEMWEAKEKQEHRVAWNREFRSRLLTDLGRAKKRLPSLYQPMPDPESFKRIPKPCVL